MWCLDFPHSTSGENDRGCRMSCGGRSNKWGIPLHSPDCQLFDGALRFQLWRLLVCLPPHHRLISQTLTKLVSNNLELCIVYEADKSTIDRGGEDNKRIRIDLRLWSVRWLIRWWIRWLECRLVSHVSRVSQLTPVTSSTPSLCALTEALWDMATSHGSWWTQKFWVSMNSTQVMGPEQCAWSKPCLFVLVLVLVVGLIDIFWGWWTHTQANSWQGLILRYFINERSSCGCGCMDGCL